MSEVCQATAGELMTIRVIAAAVGREGQCDAVPVVTVAGVLLRLVTTDLVAAVARGALLVAARAGSWKRGERD